MYILEDFFLIFFINYWNYIFICIVIVYLFTKYLFIKSTKRIINKTIKEPELLTGIGTGIAEFHSQCSVTFLNTNYITAKDT